MIQRITSTTNRRSNHLRPCFFSHHENQSRAVCNLCRQLFADKGFHDKAKYHFQKIPRDITRF
jgi:hypothetical protein